jgi:hypothetical protein
VIGREDTEGPRDGRRYGVDVNTQPIQTREMRELEACLKCEPEIAYDILASRTVIDCRGIRAACVQSQGG